LTILGNTLALILVLSVLVVAHEFGHFALAKFFGFPVEVFSVGFGKRLFGRTVRGTDYRVSAIPLGGYVRVVGLGPDESTLAEGTSAEAPLPVGKRTLVVSSTPPRRPWSTSPTISSDSPSE
jgi:regulator of sigma E protease